MIPIKNCIDRDLELRLAMKASEIPGWNRARSFRAWLGRQVTRADEIGSFARHVRNDPAFPESPLDVLNYLTLLLAPREALDAASRAVAEWRDHVRADWRREIADLRERGAAELAEQLEAGASESFRIMDGLFA